MASVADAQEALIDLIADSGEFPAALISFAPPLELPKEDERIYGFNEANYTLGGGEQFREESFSLRLVVEVYTPGNDARACNRRRWDLINGIDTILTNDDFMGYYTSGLTLQAESELVAYDKGYLARSVLAIGAEEQV